MQNSEDALRWARNIINNKFCQNVISECNIVNTAYSTVYAFNSAQGCYYLKQTPEKLALEAPTIEFIHNTFQAAIPEVIACNTRLHCFLMKQCGELTLRQHFNGNLDLCLLKSGIENYTSIQREMENHTMKLINLGIPDWRIEKLPTLFQSLIHQDQLLKQDGLTCEELSLLKKRKKMLQHSCDVLANDMFPQTLDHCDLHENNLILNKVTGKICVIDWGETVITHPFFSLSGCLWNVCYHTKLTTSSEDYKRLILASIKPWTDLYSESKLLKIFDLISKLSGVYAALAYERLQKATGKPHKVRDSGKAGAITGCLQSFLKSTSLE